MAYGKPGRPREEGERYPSGKLKKPAAAAVLALDADRSPPISGALWKRMLEDGKRIFGDARFETELTRLGATGALTPSEVATGLRIAGVYGRFEYYKNLRRSAASPHYIREYIAEGAGSDAELVNFTVKEGRERDRNFVPTDRETREQEASTAFKDLQRAIPTEYRAVLEMLCVENRHVGYDGLPRARVGIALVKEHFATGQTKASRKRLKKRRLRPELAPVGTAKPVIINPLKDAFIQVQRRLNPKLSDEAVEQAWSVLCTLRAREDFRLEKSESRST